MCVCVRVDNKFLSLYLAHSLICRVRHVPNKTNGYEQQDNKKVAD